jgi:ABC-type multidrug transport system fused ATPase/permease subunit
VRPLTRLFPYIRRYPRLVIGALAFLLIAAVTTLTLPMAVRRMIDHGFSAQDAGFINTYFLDARGDRLPCSRSRRPAATISSSRWVNALFPTSAATSSTMSRNCPPPSTTPTVRARSFRG